MLVIGSSLGLLLGYFLTSALPDSSSHTFDDIIFKVMFILLADNFSSAYKNKIKAPRLLKGQKVLAR